MKAERRQAAHCMWAPWLFGAPACGMILPIVLILFIWCSSQLSIIEDAVLKYASSQSKQPLGSRTHVSAHRHRHQ